MQILLFNDLILIDCSQNNPLFLHDYTDKRTFFEQTLWKIFLDYIGFCIILFDSDSL